VSLLILEGKKTYVSPTPNTNTQKAILPPAPPPPPAGIFSQCFLTTMIS